MDPVELLHVCEKGFFSPTNEKQVVTANVINNARLDFLLMQIVLFMSLDNKPAHSGAADVLQRRVYHFSAGSEVLNSPSSSLTVASILFPNSDGYKQLWTFRIQDPILINKKKKTDKILKYVCLEPY